MSNSSKGRKSGSLKSASKRPFMLGYTVRTFGHGEKSVWVRIGAAWEHSDGQGFEVRMDAVPLDGRIVLRAVPEVHEEPGEHVGPAPPG